MAASSFFIHCLLWLFESLQRLDERRMRTQHCLSIVHIDMSECEKPRSGRGSEIGEVFDKSKATQGDAVPWRRCVGCGMAVRLSGAKGGESFLSWRCSKCLIKESKEVQLLLAEWPNPMGGHGNADVQGGAGVREGGIQEVAGADAMGGETGFGMGVVS